MFRFSKGAPRALTVVIVTVILGMTYLSNRLFDGMTTAVEGNQMKLMRSIIETALKRSEDEALARAELIASLPCVRDVFMAGDRAKLLAELQATFLGQRDRFGVDQMQFHSPQLTSFLRVHAPQKHSDDLSKFRPLVVAANRDKLSHKAPTIAATGPGVFGIASIKDKAGNHVGTFEVGLDFGAIVDAVKVAYNLELAVYMDEGPLRQFATGIKPEKLSEELRVGTYMRFHSTHSALFKEMVNAEDLAINEPQERTRVVRSVPYGVLFFPIRNLSGKTMGVIAAATDMSGTRSAAGRSFVWQIWLAIIGISILVGSVHIVIRGGLLEPMTQVTTRFAALPHEPEAAFEKESLCVELRSLSDECERLRALLATQASEAGKPS